MELDSLPLQIAGQYAQNIQNLQLDLIKSTAKAQQQIANVLLDSAVTAAASARGRVVNKTA